VISNPSDVEVWEYSPYRSRVWLSISPTLGLSEVTKQQIREKVAQLVEIEFGATLQCDVVETPDALFGSVLYHLDDLTIDQLLSRELVLMLAKSDQAKEAFLAQQPKKSETASAELPKHALRVLTVSGLWSLSLNESLASRFLPFNSPPCNAISFPI
jgi:hypothetical protein